MSIMLLLFQSMLFGECNTQPAQYNKSFYYSSIACIVPNNHLKIIVYTYRKNQKILILWVFSTSKGTQALSRNEILKNLALRLEQHLSLESKDFCTVMYVSRRIQEAKANALYFVCISLQ